MTRGGKSSNMCKEKAMTRYEKTTNLSKRLDEVTTGQQSRGVIMF